MAKQRLTAKDKAMRNACALIAEHFGQGIIAVPDETKGGRDYPRVEQINMKDAIADGFLETMATRGETQEHAEAYDAEYADDEEEGDDDDQQ